MSDLILLRPWWLICLPLLIALAVWTRHRKLAGGWVAIIDPPLLPVLRRMGLLTEGRHSGELWLPYLAAGIIAVALSGPAVQRPGSIEMRALDPMILMLDLSPSIVADARVLGNMQAAAAELLSLSGGRPVGMMVYAADAYLASAPTSDAMSLQGLVAVIEQDTIPVAGSRPDIALSSVRDLFGSGDYGLGGADLILITDGGGTGPRATEEAARLASDGARIWTLALTENAEGAPRPDENSLAELAEAGGGASLTAQEVPELMAGIAAARNARLVRDDTGMLVMRDFGPWVLMIGCIALFPLFRRRR